MDKRSAGLRAKRTGDYFENLLMFFAGRAGFNFIKIPSGCKTVGGTKLIRVKSPFDFILSSKELTIFCDAKTTEANSFSFSQIDQDQVRNLALVKNDFSLSGYIIAFGDEVEFFSVEQLKDVKPGKGLKRGSGIYMGAKQGIEFSKLSKVDAGRQND
jgi:penicillin-binding protein-related factor A (putative recombinase)